VVAQAVACQVFCFIQPFLWEMPGTAGYITSALGLPAENLEMSLKIHKEPAYQAERQIAQAGEGRWDHCKAEGPQKAATRGQWRGEAAGMAVGLLPEGFLGCLPFRPTAGL